MKCGFIGAGNMGSALARAAHAAGATVYAYDKDEQKARALAKELSGEFMTAEEIAKKADFIFLGVKPNIIPEAVCSLAQSLSENAVLVSMAAGIKIAKIEEEAPNAPIIRIMPNTPAAIGKGMILWCANSKVTEAKAAEFLAVMSRAGALDRLDEGKIDAGSAVSGCGPAFVYMFIEALADGGVQCGLTREAAQKYACQTVLGAAETVLATGKHPAELKDAVCSPGGSTIEGVHALDKSAFRGTVAEAVRAAFERTKELGK